MAYVYRHIRLDTNQPFYIGIGRFSDSYKRANQKSPSTRSRFWHNVIQKTAYEVEILMDNLSIEDAFKKEIEFIKLYGRQDKMEGTLVNLTDGGDAPDLKFGDDNPMKRSENKLKVSLAMKGKPKTEEWKKLKSALNKKAGIIPPSRKGAIMSKESVIRMVATRAEREKRRKIIYQYNLKNELIRKWDYSVTIKKENPTYSLGNISGVCRGERPMAYGFYWSYIIKQA